MTGFGKTATEINDKKISIEMRSLNSKQLDLTLKLPAFLREKESELRNYVSKEVERGKCELMIVSESHGEALFAVNEELFKQYFIQLKKLSDETNSSHTDVFGHVLSLPEVVKSPRSELEPEYFLILFSAVEECVKRFQAYRISEGNSIAADMNACIERISLKLSAIKELDERRIPKIKERITNRLAELKGDAGFDANRLEQEMIFYIEKLDINEEKSRLASHISYFKQTMEEEHSQGRKLGFITQEIGREINTIGSKANDAEIQQLVVQMKDDLEKIKEQLNNVL